MTDSFDNGGDDKTAHKFVDKKDKSTLPRISAPVIPDCLSPYRKMKRWCLWRWTWRDDSWIKPPYRNPQSFAHCDDSSTWLEHGTAMAHARQAQIGVGLMLLGLEGLVALDLDNCIDDDGTIAPWADALVERCRSYTEFSPSGRGLRIIGKANKLGRVYRRISKPDGGELEVFHNCEKYITVTGRAYGNPAQPLADVTHIVGEELGLQGDQAASLVLAQVGPKLNHAPIPEDQLPDWFLEMIKTPAAEDEDRSAVFYKVCGKAKGCGLSPEQTAELFEKYKGAGSEKYEDRRGGILPEVIRCWGKVDDQPPERSVYSTPVADCDLLDPWRESRPPAFPMEVLPTAMRRFVAAKADETGACPSAIAMSAMTAASAALTHEATVYLNNHNQFAVRGRLWTLLVGDPSQKKTPAQNGAMAPLYAIQKRERAIVAESNAEAKENGEDPKPLPHLVLMDTTPEALCVALQANNRGLLIHADEMSGFFGSMDRYASGKGGASTRATWLKAYDGGMFSMSRVGRATPPVENLSVSVLGGIQPDRLREMKDLASDGLLQRFIPVMMRRAAVGKPAFEGSAYGDYASLLERLRDYGAFHTHLTPEAAAIRWEVDRRLFALSSNDAEGSAWQSFVGKQLGHWGSFALLLHVLHGGMAASLISGEIARMAETIISGFVLQHGLTFYRSVAGTHWADQKAIGAYLAQNEGQTVTARDLARGPRCLRGLTSDEVAKRLEQFVMGGWLTPKTDRPWNKEWTVTGGLSARFSSHIEEYRRYTAEVLSKITGDDEAA